MGNTDLRVVKTKKALVNAMLESLRKKTFEDITVQYICDFAMVRRATFYTHFADKYDLLAYTIRCIYQDFPSTQKRNAAIAPSHIYEYMVEDAINFLAENMILFRSVMNSQLFHIIFNIIRTELEGEILPCIKENLIQQELDTISPKFIFNFYLHGIIGGFMWWVREDCPISKEALILQTQEMLKFNIQ